RWPAGPGRRRGRPRGPTRRMDGAGAALHRRRDGQVRRARLIGVRGRGDDRPPDDRRPRPPGGARRGHRVVGRRADHRRLTRMTVRIGFKTSPQEVDWAILDATWRRAGELVAEPGGGFDSAWLNDHLTNMDPDGPGPSLESLTLLATLVNHVPGIHAGHAVP